MTPFGFRKFRWRVTESGELDDFAWAETEAEKYEEYCIKFDEKYGDNKITDVEDFEDEYDEYDD